MRCTGPKVATTCAGGRELSVPCRGPAGCQERAEGATCDNVLGKEGDACDEEHDFACALDRKAALECQAGVFRIVTAYDGVEGCKLEGDEIKCEPGKSIGCDEIEDLACCTTFARRRKPR
jgi:hypothetical protein